MRIYGTLLFISLIFLGCESSSSSSSQLPTNTYTLEETTAQKLHLTKQGHNLTVKEHPSKVIIIDIFATWCPPCRVVAPHLSALQEKYQDEVKIIGLSIEQNKPHEYYTAFKNEYKATYSIANGADNNDLAGRIAADLQQPRSFPIPLMVIYDKEGNYFRHYVGAVPEEMIERDIQSALGQP